jgi:hypothetical protein
MWATKDKLNKVLNSRSVRAIRRLSITFINCYILVSLLLFGFGVKETFRHTQRVGQDKFFFEICRALNILLMDADDWKLRPLMVQCPISTLF